MLTFRPFLVPGLALATPRGAAEPAETWLPPVEPTFRQLQLGGGSTSYPKGLPLFASASDRPPSDGGALRIDSYRWQLENKKSDNDGMLMVILSRRIRDALWTELNRPQPSVAGRAIADTKKIGVRIAKTGDGLQNYQIALFETPPPYMNVDQVQWSLDLTTGTMEPLPYVGHEVLEWNAQTDVSRDFGPYYRKIKFRSGALSGVSLLKLLPAERLEALRRPSSPRPPAPTTVERVRIPSVKAPERPTALVRAYPAVHEAVMNQLAVYCDWKKVAPPARLYLFRLAKEILGGLYQKESENPAFSSLNIVHVWIRNYLQDPSDKNVEVDLPTNFLGKPIGPDDILFALVRNDSRNPEVYAHLEHQRTHFDSDSDNADFRFTQALGIWPSKLHIRWDALHFSFEPKI